MMQIGRRLWDDLEGVNGGKGETTEWRYTDFWENVVWMNRCVWESTRAYVQWMLILQKDKVQAKRTASTTSVIKGILFMIWKWKLEKISRLENATCNTIQPIKKRFAGNSFQFGNFNRRLAGIPAY